MLWKAQFCIVDAALFWLVLLGITGFLTSLLPTLSAAPDVTWTLSVLTPRVVFLLAKISLRTFSSLRLKAERHLS